MAMESKEDERELDTARLVQMMLGPNVHEYVVRHHKESFLDFMDFQIPHIIASNNPLTFHADYVEVEAAATTKSEASGGGTTTKSEASEGGTTTKSEASEGGTTTKSEASEAATTKTEPATMKSEAATPAKIEPVKPKDVGAAYPVKKPMWTVRINVGKPVYQLPVLKELSGISRPMVPQDARMRGGNYDVKVYADLDWELCHNETGEKFTGRFPNHFLFHLPTMVRTRYCTLDRCMVDPLEVHEAPEDAGGYFVTAGNERTQLAQEKVADNRVMVYDHSRKPKRAKLPFAAELKSVTDEDPLSPKKMEVIMTDAGLVLGTFPRLAEPVPIVVLFRALGIQSDRDILTCIWRDAAHPGYADLIDAFVPSLLHARSIGVVDRSTALEYLKRVGNVAPSALLTECLPNSPTTKHLTIGMMIFLLFETVVAGRRDFDDKDNYKNKRITLSGTLLTQRFRQLYQRAIKDMKTRMNQHLNKTQWRKDPATLLFNRASIVQVVNLMGLERKFHQSINTGNFNNEGATSGTKNGISQILNRISASAAVSHLMRIHTPVDNGGKIQPPRKLHGSSRGYICPVETQEGDKVGLVKSLAMGATVTMAFPSRMVISSLRAAAASSLVATIPPLDISSADSSAKKYSMLMDAGVLAVGEITRDITWVSVNGQIVFATYEPREVYALAKRMKQDGTWHPHTSVAWNTDLGVIEIECDRGRVVRPLLRLPLTASRFRCPPRDWDEAVTSGLVEYLSPLEAEMLLIAPKGGHATPYLPYTHVELCDSLSLGYMANLIPFADCNQGPRNIYSSNMTKQGMGKFVTNAWDRYEKNGYDMPHADFPLVSTSLARMMRFQDNPFGKNVTIAIMAYEGWNQEDAMIVNAGFVARGGLDALYTTMYRNSQSTSLSGHDEHFTRPKPHETRGYLRNSSYDAIDDSGMPRMHAIVQPNDVIIGKVSSSRDSDLVRDCSMTSRASEPMRVDGVFKCRNSDGHPSVKVRLMSLRRPEVGNKLSSVHSQKGTIGRILPEADMPFTADGLRPDVIMNPHAIPSRMTIGHILEMAAGKAAALSSAFADGTSFGHMSPADISRQLQELGFHPSGEEFMYNGMTGERIRTTIFVGPLYLMALKHMVVDKIHVRSSGKVVLLTRQPSEGRSRDGGLRLGEMERDAFGAHGAAWTLQERFTKLSDGYDIIYCAHCGRLAAGAACKRCKNYSDFKHAIIPYAMKLLMQESAAMGLEMRCKGKGEVPSPLNP